MEKSKSDHELLTRFAGNDRTIREETEPIQRQAFWSWHSYRLRLAILMCLCVASQSLMRQNVGFAVVCMVNATWLEQYNNAYDDGDHDARDYNKSTTPVVHNYNNSTTSVVHHAHTVFDTNQSSCHLTEAAKHDYEGTLHWTIQDQSWIFVGPVWSAFLTSVIIGWLSDRYGPKNLLMLGTVSHIIGNVLIPLVALHCPFSFVIVLRLIIGVGLGTSMPCISSMISQWYPTTEKSTVVAIWTTGNQLASVICNPLAAYFCQLRQVLGGWPLIFYSTSFLGVIFCVFWHLFATNSPGKNKFVSKIECLYIEQQVNDNVFKKRKDCAAIIPWRSIATSGALWACMMCNIGFAAFGNTLALYIPTYFRTALKLDLKSNGLLSCLPFVCQFLAKMTSSVFADWLKRTERYSHTTICKVFNSISSFGAALCLVCLSFVTCESVGVAVTLLCVAYSCFAACIPGFMTSLVTIAPAYSGTISGVTRIAGLSGALAGPFLVGIVVQKGDPSEWRILFCSIAVWMILSGILFCFLGSADVQPWASPLQANASRAAMLDAESNRLTKNANSVST